MCFEYGSSSVIWKRNGTLAKGVHQDVGPAKTYRNITAAFDQIADLAIELVQYVEYVHHVVLLYQTAPATFRYGW